MYGARLALHTIGGKDIYLACWKVGTAFICPGIMFTVHHSDKTTREPIEIVRNRAEKRRSQTRGIVVY